MQETPEALQNKASGVSTLVDILVDGQEVIGVYHLCQLIKKSMSY